MKRSTFWGSICSDGHAYKIKVMEQLCGQTTILAKSVEKNRTVLYNVVPFVPICHVV